MKRYASVLESVPSVSAWVVDRRRVLERQRFLLADAPEAERTVESTTVDVVVFNDHRGGQGRSQFTLFGEEAPLDRQRVKDAVYMATLQSNPPYALPGPSEMPAVELRDPALAGDERQLIDDLQERIFAAVARESGVRLSAAELFVRRFQRELRSSSGVEAASESTSLYLEFILLARDGAEEVESAGMYRVRRFDDLPIEDLIARHAQRARDALQAELPASRLGPVVLSQGAFIPLFQPLRFGTSGEAIYRKMSPLTLGEPVLGDRTIHGDILHLASDPTLPFGTASTPFDAEGLALGRISVIQGGRFSAIAASKRYADYLGTKPLGSWTNSVLAAGDLEAAELHDLENGSVYEIVEFSWLNPNMVTGSFSTEIRLGYEHSRQGIRVIKGGSLSGNVYDAFSEVRMARETELIGDYFGPARLRFEALQVTGG